MGDAALEQILSEVEAQAKEGLSGEQMERMGKEFLAQQPKVWADAHGDKLLKKIRAMAEKRDAAEMRAHWKQMPRGLRALIWVFLLFNGLLNLFRGKKVRTEKREKFLSAIREGNAEAKKLGEKRKQERIEAGEPAEVGTGKPLPKVLLVESEEEEALDYKETADGLGAMIAAIEAAKLERNKRVFARLRLGQGRLGGAPDLPADKEWPTFQGKKIPFLAQIDLSEVPAGRLGNLPADGWLYAFGLFDNEEEHKPAPFSAFVHRGARKDLVRANWPEKEEVWPDWTGVGVYEVVPMTPLKEGEKYVGKNKRRGKGEMQAWIFGEMEDYFGTPGEMADYANKGGEDWINLLAITSVGSMQWSDAGHLYLLIRRGDLEKGDFSKVFGAICSS